MSGGWGKGTRGGQGRGVERGIAEILGTFKLNFPEYENLEKFQFSPK